MARDDRYDAKDPHEAERRGLLRQIEEEVAGTAHWLGKDRLAPAVMAAIAQVPRHAFVPRMEEAHAYRNEPFTIGLGQTIPQQIEREACRGRVWQYGLSPVVAVS